MRASSTGIAVSEYFKPQLVGFSQTADLIEERPVFQKGDWIRTDQTHILKHQVSDEWFYGLYDLDALHDTRFLDKETSSMHFSLFFVEERHCDLKCAVFWQESRQEFLLIQREECREYNLDSVLERVDSGHFIGFIANKKIDYLVFSPLANAIATLLDCGKEPAKFYYELLRVFGPHRHVSELGKGAFNQVYHLEVIKKVDNVKDWVLRIPLKKGTTEKEKSKKQITEEKFMTFSKERFGGEFLAALIDSPFVLSPDYYLVKNPQTNEIKVLDRRACKEYFEKFKAHKLGIEKGVSCGNLVQFVPNARSLKDELDVRQCTVREGPFFSEKEIANIAKNILHGLRVFPKGIVHRDIKPANILIIPEKKYQLIDFGLAVFQDNTCGQSVCGSPTHMGPEMFGQPGEQYDAKTDLYSLGSTLFELTTGHSIDQASSIKELIAAKIQSYAQAKLPSKNAGFMHYSPSLEYQNFINAIAHPQPSCRFSIEDLLRHNFLLLADSFSESNHDEDGQETDAEASASNATIPALESPPLRPQSSLRGSFQQCEEPIQEPLTMQSVIQGLRDRSAKTPPQIWMALAGAVSYCGVRYIFKKNLIPKWFEYVKAGSIRSGS